MKLLALADLHGNLGFYREAMSLIQKHRPDSVVLLGDLLPDPDAPKEKRLEAQIAFWTRHRWHFQDAGIPTTFVRGNHEVEGFQDPDFSILPTVLQGRTVRLEGIPAEHGAWGWSREWGQADLASELDGELARNPDPWLYLTHVPPLGLCDQVRVGEHIGHRPLARHLHDRSWPSALVLCGHVHQAFGTESAGETLVCSVAGGFALLRAKLATPTGPMAWEIEAMGRF